MRYLALAADFDGTLAHDGQVQEPTIQALERLRESGRRLVLVTGRQLEDLLLVFPRLELFDRVVAENGALLYRPAGREKKPLAEPPPAEFVRALEKRGVAPLSVGHVIVATWEPHQAAVLDVIRNLGLELQVIFNKGAVMVLPSGVNKATGLAVALGELGISPHNTVGVGDAENDHAFLALCECSAAVANALPTLKERADLVTRGDHGAGVVELITELIADDLASRASRLGRHDILVGTGLDGTDLRVPPYGANVLVCGTSGSGKSTLTTGFLERLAEPGYQFVVIDPEGDYTALEGAVVLGDPQRPVKVEEVLDLLEPAYQNAVVNLLGFALEHRPMFFESLLPRLQNLRARCGRPHWIVVDEAHHLLPSSRDPALGSLPGEMQTMLFITVHPGSLATSVLKGIDLVLAVGETPEETISTFCEAAGLSCPQLEPVQLPPGESLAWWPRVGSSPVRIRTAPASGERRRHSRKYAEGDLGPDRSFYFHGPDGKLNLRAQNLQLFLQLAEGVDDATWLHHLKRGDYSHWFREGIKDADLAAEAQRIEAQQALSADESRKAIREAIEHRYTRAADAEQLSAG